jgi:membrane protease YdiL (CAAX protease family)
MQKVTLPRLALVVVKAAVIALVIEIIGDTLWGVLAEINFASTPNLPWAVLPSALILYLLWRYTGGWGWPARTADSRRTYRRANRVSVNVYLKALLAGGLSIVALGGWWVVLYRLIPTQPNLVPDLSPYPLTTTIPFLIIAIIAAPLTEEIAFRGYAQGMLERVSKPATAVLISSILFALAHLTQGPYVSKLLVYFLVGAMLGTIAILTNSILPGMIVHSLGDLTFFVLIWPNDASRTLISVTGPDTSFWISLAQAVVFSVLATLAFLYLRNATRAAPPNESRAAAAGG